MYKKTKEDAAVIEQDLIRLSFIDTITKCVADGRIPLPDGYPDWVSFRRELGFMSLDSLQSLFVKLAPSSQTM